MFLKHEGKNYPSLNKQICLFNNNLTKNIVDIPKIIFIFVYNKKIRDMNTVIFLSLDIAMVLFFAFGVHNIINGFLFQERNTLITGIFDFVCAIIYTLILHSLLIN